MQGKVQDGIAEILETHYSNEFQMFQAHNDLLAHPSVLDNLLLS